MVWTWEPQAWSCLTQYNVGDVVEYEGIDYRVIQAHVSQSDWSPNIVPALFNRLPEDQQRPPHAPGPAKNQWGGGNNDPCSNCGGNCGDTCQNADSNKCGNCGGDCGGTCGGYGGHPAPQPEQAEPSQPPLPPQVVDHNSWFNFSDQQKTELEVGGGIAAGLAALGAGYFGYKHHEKTQEQQKAHAFALTAWIQEAKKRRDAFYVNGVRPPTIWVYNEGHHIPKEALHGGYEEGHPLFICRSYVEGGLHIGKAAPEMPEGAVAGQYEVLLGNPRLVRWVDFEGTFDIDRLGAIPVEGGHEANGQVLYIAQAEYNGGVHPGKVGATTDGAYISYANREKSVKQYRVLCYVEGVNVQV
ncbi:hypothetical protein SISNIDRAFT_546349 [Sistotremastrum niveocremeum HHB9708]|uniref:Chitin-binding type-3 domain-containing protein n=1 Tax=Sistotremastrum niveocremeum HHB9708 TaxID=1314777 RepID=A0A165A2G1_9AGAM|nr:hypothetical protein SISNIDRAFT_546349 [Sistotremastrum niveocremeum HHB9708]